VGTHLVCS